ncbi:MAG: NosD domain-containing protein [Candidatus Thorarchaeota archaeon]
MKSKIYLKMIFIILFGVFLVTSTINVKDLNPKSIDNDLNEKLNLSKVSGKIHIKNNWSDAKAAGICTGNGTPSNPYLIEDLEIDGGAVGSCILIENSDDHFTILNCFFNNSKDDFMLEEAGIKLVNSSNGQLINNTFSNPGGTGIFFYLSNDTTLIGNSLKSNLEAGFRVVFCHNIHAYLNNFRGSSINVFFMDSTHRFFSERKITYIYNGRTYARFIGNFWSSTYSGDDDNGDGIGDDPIIWPDGGLHLIDQYPLIDSIENYQIIGFARNAIPGYNFFLILGIISIVSVFIIKKIKK